MFHASWYFELFFPSSTSIFCFSTDCSCCCCCFCTTSFICRISPSTRLDMILAMSWVTSGSPRRAKAAEARPRMKLPPRTESLLLNIEGAEGAPRRRAEASMTSSCNSDAVCSISTICARRSWVGRIVSGEWSFGNDGGGSAEWG